MDDLIHEILAEIPDPVPVQFTDLDDQVPHPVRLPADQWVEILNHAKGVRSRRRRDGLLFMEGGRRRPMTSVITRSLMVFMSEQADWLWMPA
ncbi:MAG: hypothetical protein AB2556_23275 [Candidatus Thiodiazotropha sp.]